MNWSCSRKGIGSERS